MNEPKQMEGQIEESTRELMQRILKKLQPPPNLDLAQWADEYRRLSSEASAEPGRWRTDKAPFQREIMQAISDPHVRKVVVKSCAQIGKTDGLIMNTIGYYMHWRPCGIMMMQPTISLGEEMSKTRLDTMLRDSPCLSELVDRQGRRSGNTIMYKKFPGGYLRITGANSTTDLAGRPIKVLLADEVDRYPISAGEEGNPLLLAEKRQTTFWDRKTVVVSTPTMKSTSRIEAEYINSTMEEWNVPCPQCSKLQPFTWAQLKFDKENPQDVRYECSHCGYPGEEWEWKNQNRNGKYVAAHPKRKVRGFHLNTLASPFCGWPEIVEKFLKAKRQLDQGQNEDMIVFMNTELGEVWDEKGESVEGSTLYDRKEWYGCEVPDDVLILTAGIDTQDDRFEVEVVGWGKGLESWGIRYQKIYGDLKQPQIWEELDKFLLQPWHKADGTEMLVVAACMDTGGHFSNEVAQFCKARWHRRIMAIKGKNTPEAPYIPKERSSNREGAPLWMIGVDAGKSQLYQRLQVQVKGPNYCHWPLEEEAGYDEAYFEGLTAEKLVVRYRKGRAIMAWEIKDAAHKRNEPLDIRNYATAAVKITNPAELRSEPGSKQRKVRQGRRMISSGS